jgi:hypothetical protein
MTTDALRRALVQHEAFVRELALVLTRNSTEADDVAQEVLLHTLERHHGVDTGLRAWLASSTRRIAWNLRRSERRRSERERRAARPEALSDPTATLAARQQLVDAVLPGCGGFRPRRLCRVGSAVRGGPGGQPEPRRSGTRPLPPRGRAPVDQSPDPLC